MLLLLLLFTYSQCIFITPYFVGLFVAYEIGATVFCVSKFASAVLENRYTHADTAEKNMFYATILFSTSDKSSLHFIWTNNSRKWWRITIYVWGFFVCNHTLNDDYEFKNQLQFCKNVRVQGIYRSFMKISGSSDRVNFARVSISRDFCFDNNIDNYNIYLYINT